MVGGDVSGDVGGREVDDVLRDELPDDLAGRILLDEDHGDDRDDELADLDEQGEMTTGQAIARLVDGDLGPNAPTGPGASTPTDAVATDGGETDEQ
jgi:hypothetical protein